MKGMRTGAASNFKDSEKGLRDHKIDPNSATHVAAGFTLLEHAMTTTPLFPQPSAVLGFRDSSGPFKFRAYKAIGQ
jgi:hypothetical protein